MNYSKKTHNTPQKKNKEKYKIPLVPHRTNEMCAIVCKCTAYFDSYNINITVLQVCAQTISLYLYCRFGPSQYNCNYTKGLGQ